VWASEATTKRIKRTKTIEEESQQSLVNNNFSQAIETDQNGPGVTCAAVKGFRGFWTLVIPPFHGLWTRTLKDSPVTPVCTSSSARPGLKQLWALALPSESATTRSDCKGEQLMGLHGSWPTGQGRLRGTLKIGRWENGRSRGILSEETRQKQRSGEGQSQSSIRELFANNAKSICTKAVDRSSTFQTLRSRVSTNSPFDGCVQEECNYACGPTKLETLDSPARGLLDSQSCHSP
jgi:hypothetical protein